MKLKKLSAVMMTAILATSSPVSAYLGEISSYAKSKDDDDDDKDYSIGDAAWDTSEDTEGKTHVYATWTEADTKSTGTITIFVDGKNRTSEAKKTGSISTSTTSGKYELTNFIKKINRTGSYTFKITAGKKNKGEDEKSYSESDTLDVDKDFLKSLATSSSSGSSEVNTNGNSSSSSGTTKSSGATPADAMNNASQNAAPASGSSPADAMNNASQNAAQDSSQDAAQQEITENPWQDWGYGWVYFENGALVTNRWVQYEGKYYHLGATGFKDVNTYVTDENGTHYVGPDGAMMF